MGAERLSETPLNLCQTTRRHVRQHSLLTDSKANSETQHCCSFLNTRCVGGGGLRRAELLAGSARVAPSCWSRFSSSFPMLDTCTNSRKKNFYI
jgi:hypothetical protein